MLFEQVILSGQKMKALYYTIIFTFFTSVGSTVRFGTVDTDLGTPTVELFTPEENHPMTPTSPMSPSSLPF